MSALSKVAQPQKNSNSFWSLRNRAPLALVTSVSFLCLAFSLYKLTEVPTSALAVNLDQKSTGTTGPASANEISFLILKARSGDLAAAQQAVALSELGLLQKPKDIAFSTLLGSAYCLVARNSSDVLSKMRFAKRGLDILDEAVERAPDDFALRVTRGLVQANLPALFSRHARAITDLAAAVELQPRQTLPVSKAQMAEIFAQLISLNNADGDTAAELHWQTLAAAYVTQAQ